MYNGNVMDFADQVIKYVEDTHNLRITFYSSDNADGAYILRETGRWTRNWNLVYDSEDFEDKVYAIVNRIIKQDY